MPAHSLSRRHLLASAAGGTLAAALAPSARAATSDGFRFEIERSEADWRAMLSAEEYEILREGGTEFPTTSPYWDDYTEGAFHCRGCDLHLYSSDWRARIELGFVFFEHAEPRAVLMGIDRTDAYGMGNSEDSALIEVHCRRCGSHQGHILVAQGQLVHCINGTSLVRRPVAS